MKYLKTIEIIEKLFLNKLNPTIIIRHELLSKNARKPAITKIKDETCHIRSIR